MGKRAYGLIPFLLILLSLFSLEGAWAEDGRSYEELLSWLEGSRTAEATFQPGQRLTLADQEKLKPFLPLPAWELFFYPDMVMEFAATGDYTPYPEYIQRAKEVAGKIRLDEEGGLQGFTGGGFPFSPEEIAADDPQAGVKVMWNYWWRPGAHDYYMPMVSWSYAEGGKLDREFHFTEIDHSHARGDHCLVPGEEEVDFKNMTIYRHPRDMSGMKILTVKYLDPYKEDDSWTYVPGQRKPRRTLASERTSEIPGMDFIPEDGYGFRGRISQHAWKYLGTKRVLATMNLANYPDFGGPHKWVPHGARWELRDCHVVEGVPKDTSHPYSRRVIFIDAQTFWATWMVAYDREGKIYRVQHHSLKFSESYNQGEQRQPPFVKVDYTKNLGKRTIFHLGQEDINMKKRHATIIQCYTVWDEALPEKAKELYSVRNLVSGGR